MLTVPRQHNYTFNDGLMPSRSWIIRLGWGWGIQVMRQNRKSKMQSYRHQRVFFVYSYLNLVVRAGSNQTTGPGATEQTSTEHAHNLPFSGFRFHSNIHYIPFVSTSECHPPLHHNSTTTPQDLRRFLRGTTTCRRRRTARRSRRT